MYQDSTPSTPEDEEKEDSDLELSENASDDDDEDNEDDEDKSLQYTYTKVTERPERVPVLAPSAQLYPSYVAPQPVTYYYHSYYPTSSYYSGYRHPFRYPLTCSGAPYYYCYPYVRH